MQETDIDVLKNLVKKAVCADSIEQFTEEMKNTRGIE